MLHEEANEDAACFEVVFVSSDTSASACAEYMSAMHGDWLRVPFDDPLRQELKSRYGCFAGKEAADHPAVERRCGIPAIVVVGEDGTEHALLDCEAEGLALVNKLGSAVVEQWKPFAWYAPPPRVVQDDDGLYD